jgi:hypothetical protein
MFRFKSRNKLLLEYIEVKLIELEERLKYVEDTLKVEALKQRPVNTWQNPEDRT